MIFVYLSLVVLLVACVWTVAKALEQPPKHTPNHRGERRRRPSGDLLTDEANDDDLLGWPPAAPGLTPAEQAEAEAVAERVVETMRRIGVENPRPLGDDVRDAAAQLRAAVREETPNA